MEMEESNFLTRLYYKATVIMTVWYCHKNRNIDQLNKIEIPEINLVPSILPLTRKARIYMERDSLFNKWYGITRQLHVKG